VLRNFLQRVVEIRLRGLEALQELLRADAGALRIRQEITRLRKRIKIAVEVRHG